MVKGEEKCEDCGEMFDSRVGGYIDNIRVCDGCLSQESMKCDKCRGRGVRLGEDCPYCKGTGELE